MGDVLAMMPTTDKQKRHEKRVKAKERDERRQTRRARAMGEEARDFDLVPVSATGDDDDDEEVDLMAMEGMSEEKKKKIMNARKLIKAGMGKVGAAGGKSTSFSKKGQEANNRFEVVEQDRPLPTKDDRKYDSGNEEYDSDDHVETMALGTMMLRLRKQRHSLMLHTIVLLGMILGICLNGSSTMKIGITVHSFRFHPRCWLR